MNLSLIYLFIKILVNNGY